MTTNFKVSQTDVRDGELVDFGDLNGDNPHRLRIPATFQRVVEYSEPPLRAVISCVFTGERIEVVSLEIASTTGFVATKYLTQLALPAVIREIAMDVIPDSHWWTQEFHDGQSSWGGDNVTMGFLAQLYWFEHVSWGSPRLRIMEYMGCKRTTANEYIRRAAREFVLPGAHAKAAEGI